ncbi:MAG: signal recognition particle-docking protein FtsY [Acidimicrobiales bacterium]
MIIVLIAVLVAVLASGAFVVTGRRRGRVGPPPSRPAAPPPPPPQPVAPTLETLPAPAEAPPAEAPPVEGPPVEGQVPLVEVRPTFRDRLGKARSLFSGYLSSVRSRDRIDAETWEELEEALILADVGVEVTAAVLQDLRARVKAEGLTDPAALVDALKSDLAAKLAGDRQLQCEPGVTNVWLFVGVNGVGKTTTIGKLGMRQSQAGNKVVFAAGDTFRAAAADQLQLWGDRVDATVVRGNEGGDPGAVIFDAVAHAAARSVDLVLADTAGRLHTKVNLMEELKKVRRVAERPPGRLSEVLLVIDATTGQNGLVQAKQFASAVGVTGVVLTKLDGTAKGGIAVAISVELGIPIKLVGLGEGAADLVDFDPDEYVDALMAE